MRIFANELRWAARRLVRTPASTLAAGAVLALTIASTVTVCAVARSVLLAPLPFPEPDRLVVVERQIGGERTPLHSPVDLLDLRERCEAFSALSASARFRTLLTGADHPTYVTGASVTPELLETLGAEPVVGRVFRAGPGGEASEPDAVAISWALWRKHLRGDRDVVGKPLFLGDETRIVVAVMPEELSFLGVDLWVPGPRGVPQPPIPVDSDLLVRRDLAYVTILGRLEDGWSLEAAGAALEAAGAGVAEAYPPDYPELRFTLESFEERVFAQARDHLTILWVCVGLVFFLGCLSVSGLLLARGIARADQDAIKVAIGATRRQVALSALAESAVLAIAGGVVGGLAAVAGIRLFLALAPAFPRSEQTSADPWIVVGAALAALLAAILAGLLPTIKALGRRGNAIAPTTARASASRGRKHSWNGLLAIQVACMVVLLVAAAVLARRALELGSLDLGFEPRGVLVTLLELPAERYQDPETLSHFYGEVLDRLAALPDVESVGAALPLPLSGTRIGGSFSIVGASEGAGGPGPGAGLSSVSHGYFRTLGIPVLEGRAFGPEDRLGAPRVAVVNRTLADQYWKDGTPLGTEIVLRDGVPVRIVGIVQDVRHDLVEPEVEGRIYQPLLQQPARVASLTVRTRGGSERLDRAVRAVVGDVDPGQPVPEAVPMERMLSQVLRPVHYLLVIVGGLAGLALVITAVGLYSLLALTVREQERDLSMRLALGASRATLLRAHLGRGLLIATVGTLAGTVAALNGAPLLERVVSANEEAGPLLVSAVALLVVVSATLSSLLGARRVLRLSPARAVRDP